MEACLSAHFVSRLLRQLGHEPRIIPAIYVKAFVKGQRASLSTFRRNSAQACDPTGPALLTKLLPRGCGQATCVTADRRTARSHLNFKRSLAETSCIDPPRAGRMKSKVKGGHSIAEVILNSGLAGRKRCMLAIRWMNWSSSIYGDVSKITGAWHATACTEDREIK